MTRDPYFLRSEVSNSDLSKLKQLLGARDEFDPTQAFAFGTLVDALLTEPEKVDHYRREVSGIEYSPAEWVIAMDMQRAFKSDKFCTELLAKADCQKVMSRELALSYQGINFTLPVRCKWDLWMPHVGWGGDIKSTTATTQAQFEAAIQYFDYDRQRAWYMDIAESDNDILIGISKVNYKIFKVPIKRGSALYNSGREKYLDLAFKYWYLFCNS